MRNYFNQNDKPKWTLRESVNGLMVFAILFTFLFCFWDVKDTSDPNGEKQRALYPYKTVDQLEAKINELETTMPGRVEPEVFYPWLAESRIAGQAIKDFSQWGELQEPQTTAMQNRLKAIETVGLDQAELSRFNMGTTTKAQQVYYQPALAAATVPTVWKPMLPRLALAYAISCALMLLLMLYKAKVRGYRLVAELLTPTRLPLAVPFWLFTVWAYPFGSPLKSLQKSLRFATYVLASIMSISAAGAKVSGQTGGAKKTGKSQPTTDWTIQADARWGEVINGDGPEPQRQLRITVTSPGGWISENIASSNDRQANLFFSGGKRIIQSKFGTVNLLGGFRVMQDKIRGSTDYSVAVNTQMFNTVNLPKGSPGFSAVNINTPVMQFEKGVTGSSANKKLNFTVVNQTFLKAKKGNVFPGWETVVSKTAGRPLSWSMGPLFEWKIPKKNFPRLGIGYLFNQQGVGVLRFRLTETFSF